MMCSGCSSCNAPLSFGHVLYRSSAVVRSAQAPRVERHDVLTRCSCIVAQLWSDESRNSDSCRSLQSGKRTGEMGEQATLDAIIVGAGPAGLSAALILGRCCRDVLVFDT